MRMKLQTQKKLKIMCYQHIVVKVTFIPLDNGQPNWGENDNGRISVGTLSLHSQIINTYGILSIIIIRTEYIMCICINVDVSLFYCKEEERDRDSMFKQIQNVNSTSQPRRSV